MVVPERSYLSRHWKGHVVNGVRSGEMWLQAVLASPPRSLPPLPSVVHAYLPNWLDDATFINLV